MGGYEGGMGVMWGDMGSYEGGGYEGGYGGL